MSHFERTFNAKMQSVIVLIFMLCSAASSAIQRVNGWYGSDLHLTLSQLCGKEFFDVKSKGTLIGTYHVPTLKGFKHYNDRFEFYPQSCTFTIRRFSETDDHNFTFTSLKSEVRMDFEVAATDYLTSLPALNTMEYSVFKANTTEEECISGLSALGLSLNPIICLVVILLAYMIKEKLRNNAETVSCTQRVVAFFGGKYDRNRINLGCAISKLVSLACQATAIILMEHCGESAHGRGWFIATIIPAVIQVLPAAVWIYIAWKWDAANMSPVQNNPALFLHILEWALSLAFPLCLCLWYFSLYSAGVSLYIPIVFLLASVILNILIIFLCHCKKRTDRNCENGPL